MPPREKHIRQTVCAVRVGVGGPFELSAEKRTGSDGSRQRTRVVEKARRMKKQTRDLSKLMMGSSRLGVGDQESDWQDG